jgi:phospholipid/cholesterol/gamma-HCH transport system permease protein
MSSDGKTPAPSPSAENALRLPEALDIHSVPTLRSNLMRDVKAGGGTAVVEASAVQHIDGVGLGLLAELNDISQRLFHRSLNIEGLRPPLAHLVHVAALNSADRTGAPAKHSRISDFGAAVAGIFSEIYILITFIGDVAAAAGSVIVSPRQVRWSEFPSLMRSIGADALFIISLLGFLIGAILAFQTTVPLDRFGAIELIPTIVGIAILRELGPLIAAILVAGRTGAAFAAELGTMHVTEELAALKVMGINPMTFLVIPRILATVLMLPVLCVYTNFLGILGGYCVMISRGFSYAQYMETLKAGVHLEDAVGGVAKTLAFGALIAIAGCQCGMQTGAGPAAVGRSTTRAVVSSIVLIVIADVVFGFLFYLLGI